MCLRSMGESLRKIGGRGVGEMTCEGLMCLRNMGECLRKVGCV